MTALLEAKNLSKSFGKRKVVKDVSFLVQHGEIVGLLGPNGAGKSTSFNMVAGLLVPDAGHVILENQELGHLVLYERAQQGLGYLPQESTVFRALTVTQNLLVALEIQRITGAEANRIVQDVLAQYHLTHVAHTLGAQLSGGEKRRLEMARTLIPKPKIVLLDEPFAGVDPIAVAEIKGFVQSVRAAGIGVLLTDHNVRETLAICDRAYLISEGTILLSGTPQEIVQNELAREKYLGKDFQL